MIDNKEISLVHMLAKSSPEERKDFWKQLLGETGFYCPYIPLQMIRVKELDNSEDS